MALRVTLRHLRSSLNHPAMAFTPPFKYPPSIATDASEERFGHVISEPYKYLEDGSDKRTEAWVELQAAHTNAILGTFPRRADILQEFTDAYNYERMEIPSQHGKKWYFSHNSGLQKQSVIYSKIDILNAAEDRQVFFDPNLLSEDGTVSLGSTSFSKDGLLWAYQLSTGGSDWSVIQILTVTNGQKFPERLDQVKFSGISWTHDNLGFFYSRMPQEDKTSQGATDATKQTEANADHTVWYHRVGTPQTDDIKFATAYEKEWLIGASVSECGKYVYVTQRNGCLPGNDFAYASLEHGVEHAAKNLYRLVEQMVDKYSVVAHVGDHIYFITNADAPRKKFVRTNARNFADTVVVLAEHATRILEDAMQVNNDWILMEYLENVNNEIWLAPLDDLTAQVQVELPIASLRMSCEFDHNYFFVSLTSFTLPNRILHFTIDASGKVSAPARVFDALIPGVDPDALEVNQEWFLSTDGTRVPMFVVHKRGLERNGKNPAVVYAYGGFHISMTPFFSVFASTFIVRTNAVYVVVNARGGGEFGEKWWQSGRGENKQNTFEDVKSAVRHLVAQEFTSYRKTCIMGGSNGGLTVAACANQNPELFGAVVCKVGVLDMFNFHKVTIGHAWRSDYGDPDVEVDFNVVRKFSPLHNIPKDVPYFPKFLAFTADHDDRVVPLHTFKFVAMAQNTLPNTVGPVLVRIDVKAGHGAGKPTTKLIEEAADTYAFILAALDATWQ